MKFISLGGWCGPAIGMDASNYRNEALPFDYIRSTFTGVIRCLRDGFKDFFPDPIIRDDGFRDYYFDCKSFRGKDFSFFHHDLFNTETIEAFHRRFERFTKLLHECKEITFVRCSNTYMEEVKFKDEFHKVMNDKYPNLKYKLCFIIPFQDKTCFIKKLDDKTYLFAVNDSKDKTEDTIKAYRPLIEFMAMIDEGFEPVTPPDPLDKHFTHYSNIPIFKN